MNTTRRAGWAKAVRKMSVYPRHPSPFDREFARRLPWQVLDSVLGWLHLGAASLRRQDMDWMLDRRTFSVEKHGRGPSTTRRTATASWLGIASCGVDVSAVNAKLVHQASGWRGEVNMRTKRLTITFALTLGILVVPLVADAQVPAKVPRIGTLAFGSNPDRFIETFLQRLRQLGYADGQTLAVEGRYADGQPERLPDLAAEQTKPFAPRLASAPGLWDRTSDRRLLILGSRFRPEQGQEPRSS